MKLRQQCILEIEQPILIDHHEFLKIFRISSKTSKRWREKGLIPYIQIGKHIYFRYSDLRSFIKKYEKRYDTK